jgi:hypothetical protein
LQHKAPSRRKVSSVQDPRLTENKNWELNSSKMPEIREGGPQEHGRGHPHQESQGAGGAVGQYVQQQLPRALQFENGLEQHEK